MTIGTIIFYIFVWILILFFLAILVILCIWMWTGLKAKVPFVPVPNSILPEIEKALDLKEGSVVYDLGCGDARVLSYLASRNRNKNIKFIGIENSWFPINLARLLTWWNKKRGKGEVSVVAQDFFKYDLSNATHIFVYLYPTVMDDLLSKFDKELSPKTKLVSVTFQFTQKKPIFEVDLERKSYQLAKKMYVYEF